MLKYSLSVTASIFRLARIKSGRECLAFLTEPDQKKYEKFKAYMIRQIYRVRVIGKPNKVRSVWNELFNITTTPEDRNQMRQYITKLTNLRFD
jgi:hypothetical protein